MGDIEVGLHGGLKVDVRYSCTDRGIRVLREYLRPVDVVMLRAPGEDWMFTIPRPLMEYLLECARRVDEVSRAINEDEVEPEFDERELPTLSEFEEPEGELAQP